MEVIGGFTDDEVHSIMKYLDVDGDGGITKAEFTAQMEKANKVYDVYNTSESLKFSH